MAIKLKVTQVRSTIGRPKDQVATVKGLGLRRIHHSAVVPDTLATRGMIRKVSHLITVAPAE